MQQLIVTLVLDDRAQQRFDDVRRRHFPPDRNVLAAHVTLFHALPGELEQEVRVALSEQAARPPLAVRVAAVRSLGRGVAYDLESPALDDVRRALARRFSAHLTPQDSRPHRPHVTVQNKVAPEQARALLAELQRDFAPYYVTGQALALWRYVGPTWEPLAQQAFSA